MSAAAYWHQLPLSIVLALLRVRQRNQSILRKVICPNLQPGVGKGLAIFRCCWQESIPGFFKDFLTVQILLLPLLSFGCPDANFLKVADGAFVIGNKRIFKLLTINSPPIGTCLLYTSPSPRDRG